MDLLPCHHEPTFPEVAAEFPRWECFRGQNQLLYAHLRDGPRVVVWGEDAQMLRDEIIRAVRLLRVGSFC